MLEDAGAFLEQAGPLLLADEARHNLILGISGTLRESPDRYIEKHFWVGIDDGEPVAAAIRTPPYNLILATPRDEPALVALAAAIEDELPGVTGTRPEVDTFARLWADAHGLEARTLRGMGVYALEHVQPVPPAPGSSRAREPSRRGAPARVDDRLRRGGARRQRSRPDRGPRRGRAPARRPRRRLPRSGRTRVASSRSPAGAGRLRTGSVSARSTRRPSYAGEATRPRSSPSSRRRSSTAGGASSSSSPTSRTRRRTRSTSASGTSGSPSRR